RSAYRRNMVRRARHPMPRRVPFYHAHALAHRPDAGPSPTTNREVLPGCASSRGCRGPDAYPASVVRRSNADVESAPGRRGVAPLFPSSMDASASSWLANVRDAARSNLCRDGRIQRCPSIHRVVRAQRARRCSGSAIASSLDIAYCAPRENSDDELPRYRHRFLPRGVHGCFWNALDQDSRGFVWASPPKLRQLFVDCDTGCLLGWIHVWNDL